MSGEEKSSTQKLGMLNEHLDAIEEKIGLPSLYTDLGDDCKSLLTMTQSDLRELTFEECSEKAYLLQQLAIVIDRSMNRQSAEINWAKAKFNRAIADDLRHCPGYTFEEKKIHIIRDNDAAKNYDNIIVSATNKLERLKNISFRIDSMSKILLSMQAGKKRT